MRNKFNMLGNLMGEPEDDNDQVKYSLFFK
jgi:hypothetical protein